MGHGERRANRSRNTEALSKVKASQSERFRELWPDIKEMILPRRGIFAHGLPADGDQPGGAPGAAVLHQAADRQRVIGHRQVELLAPLVGRCSERR